MPTRIGRWSSSHLLAAVVMAVLAVGVTRAAWGDILTIARNDPEHSHIFLVPLVAAWMVWVRWPRLRHTRPVGTVVGPLVAVLGALVAGYGFHNGVQSFWHGGSVLVVLGCVLSVLGRQVLFRFFPAVAVLVFLIPVPAALRLQISGPLQVGTSRVAEQVLAFIGMAVERSGNLLTVDGTPVNIVEACNGMRMVYGLLLVAYAFSFGLPLKNWVRLVVLALSPLAAIFCNVVRILPTVWVYGRYPENVGNLFHELAGWVMLPVAFLILLGFIKLMQWAMVPVLRYPLASQAT